MEDFRADDIGDTWNKLVESLEGEAGIGEARRGGDPLQMEELQPTSSPASDGNPAATSFTTYVDFKASLEPYIKYLWAIENHRPGLVHTLENLILNALYTLQTTQMPTPFCPRPDENQTDVNHSTGFGVIVNCPVTLPETVISTYGEENARDCPYSSEVGMTTSTLKIPCQTPTETYPEEHVLDMHPDSDEIHMINSLLKTPPETPTETYSEKHLLDTHPHSSAVPITLSPWKTPPGSATDIHLIAVSDLPMLSSEVQVLRTSIESYPDEDILDPYLHPSEIELTASPLNTLPVTSAKANAEKCVLDLHPDSSQIEITRSALKTLSKTPIESYLDEDILDLYPYPSEIEMTRSPLQTPRTPTEAHLREVSDLQMLSSEAQVTVPPQKTLPKISIESYSDEDILYLHPHPSEIELIDSLLKTPPKTSAEIGSEECALDLHPHCRKHEITTLSILKTSFKSPTETGSVPNREIPDLQPLSSKVEMSAFSLKTPLKTPKEISHEGKILDPRLYPIEITTLLQKSSSKISEQRFPELHIKEEFSEVPFEEELPELCEFSSEVDETAFFLKTSPKISTETYFEEDIYEHPIKMETTASFQKSLSKTPTKTYLKEEIPYRYLCPVSNEMIASSPQNPPKTPTVIHSEKNPDLHPFYSEIEMRSSTPKATPQIPLSVPSHRPANFNPDPCSQTERVRPIIEFYTSTLDSSTTSTTIPAITTVQSYAISNSKIKQFKEISQKELSRYPAEAYIPWPGPEFDPNYSNERWCFACHKMGHIGRECPNPRPDPYCHKCGAVGTSTYKCKWTILHQSWQKGRPGNRTLLFNPTNDVSVPQVPRASIPLAAPKPLMDLKILLPSAQYFPEPR